MHIVRTTDELRATLRGAQPSFVPTMGALHEGHLALICRATQLNTPVVVSIFVNPTQFEPGEDYEQYPRSIDSDLKKAESAGANFAFLPDVETVYPSDQPIPVPPLPDVATKPKLEDAHRPTHFAGVCQVVARLFDLVHPRFVVFGEKDYQQLLVIQGMVENELNRWPGLQIVPHSTVRKSDGIAMSSRNSYLTPHLRDRALGISRALIAAKSSSNPKEGECIMEAILKEHNVEIDYAVVRHAESLMPIDSYSHPARALIAGRVDSVRLIDNLAVERLS